MSVVVIDTLPNGVLVLEGARMVTFSGESYYAVLKGMVRKEDMALVSRTASGIETSSPLSILRMHKLNLFQRVV